MSGFDQLGRELESAAERGRARSWSSRAGGVVAVAVALATVVVIAVGAVVLLHGRGPSTPAAAATTQGAPGAQVAAWERTLNCPRERAPRLLTRRNMTNAAPSPKLLAAVGVLRGPWTAADDAPSTPCGKATGPPPPLLYPYDVDIRFVRYVGPGVHGGTVFLVPGTLMAPRLPALLLKKNPKLVKTFGRLAHLPVACLITIGGKPPAAQGCTDLTQIERPAGSFLAPPILIPAPKPATLRKICQHITQVIARSKGKPGAVPSPKALCLRAIPRRLRAVRLPPQVISGVVRDGITSLEVETHSGKRLLTVPIRDNVYSFATGGAVSGVLKLVFRNAAGRVVATSLSGAGQVGTLGGVIATPSGVAPPPIATLPLVPAPAKAKATVTGTLIRVPPPAKPRPARR
jgi:hypothetical protein